MSHNPTLQNRSLNHTYPQELFYISFIEDPICQPQSVAVKWSARCVMPRLVVWSLWLLQDLIWKLCQTELIWINADGFRFFLFPIQS